jgi:hypothetical protein
MRIARYTGIIGDARSLYYLLGISRNHHDICHIEDWLSRFCGHPALRFQPCDLTIWLADSGIDQRHSRIVFY